MSTNKVGVNSRMALVLRNQDPPLRMTNITYWCCQTVSACTAQTPRRAKDSNRRLPLPRCLAGWCWLWAPPPRHSLCERVGENHSLGIIKACACDAVSVAACSLRLGWGSGAETYLWWRPTVKLDFLLETCGRLKPGFEERANSPNSSLGGAMYTVRWEKRGKNSKGQSPAACSRQHLRPDT